MPADSEIEFRTSSYCGGSSCVEVAVLPSGVVLVRDKKNSAPGSPILSFGDAAWHSFLHSREVGRAS